VSILFSGRPLWVNRELNASRAFVAAWLPGTEGAGIADVLFRRKDGAIAHDFKGRLSYSWPRDAAGAPLNAGEPGYDPLFALGHGLDYSDSAPKGTAPVLPEDPGASAGLLNAGTFLEIGDAVEPWRLAISGESATSTPVSDGVQQVARRFVALSGGVASVAIEGDGSADFTREANGDVMLLLRLRREGPIGADTQIGMSCGTSCAAAIEVGPQLALLSLGQWRTVGLPLKCLAAAGADLSKVRAPLHIASQKGFDFTLARVQLGSNPDLVLKCGP
jgi:beta-glucosidase